MLHRTLCYISLISIVYFFSCDKSVNERYMDAAMSHDLTKIRSLLSQGVNPNYQDHTGKSALHYLMIVNSFTNTTQTVHENQIKVGPDIIFLLIEKGANLNISDKLGNSPVFFAVQNGNYETAAALINHGADVNHRNMFQRTPVFEAVGLINNVYFPTRNLQLINLLYQAGADIHVTDAEGKTLLHASKDPAVTAWLIEHGLNPGQRDKYGKTALDYFSENIFKLRDAITNETLGKNKKRT